MSAPVRKSSPAPSHRVGRAGLTSWLTACALMAAACTATAAPFEDSMAQRLQACVGCHGVEGKAAADGYYPRIAGKPAAYLYNQLVGFREGRRHYRLMTQLLDPLTDDYLREIAQHFAALDLPYPPQQSPTADANVIERGRVLVHDGDAARRIPACTQCHGPALTGVLPAIPGLLGLPRDYINGQLGAWQRGSRHGAPPDCMADVARLLKPEDINAVSQWLAAQPVPAAAKALAAPPKPLSVPCGGMAAMAAPADADRSAR